MSAEQLLGIEICICTDVLRSAGGAAVRREDEPVLMQPVHTSDHTQGDHAAVPRGKRRKRSQKGSLVDSFRSDRSVSKRSQVVNWVSFLYVIK